MTFLVYPEVPAAEEICFLGVAYHMPKAGASEVYVAVGCGGDAAHEAGLLDQV